MSSKKVLLVGYGNRGKSLFAANVCRQVLSDQYVPTQGIEVHPITLSSGVVLKLWDTAGVYKYGGLRDGYYINADIAIIFAETPGEILDWAQEVLRVVPNVKLYAYVPVKIAPQLSVATRGPVSFFYKEEVTPQTLLEIIA